VKTLVIGLIQGPVAWLAIAAAISLGLQLRRGASLPATIGVSLLGAALVWAAVGLLGSALRRWRERAAILGGASGTAPRDGASALLVGMIEGSGPPLRAPLDGSACLAYTYEIKDDRGTGRRRTISTVARGVALAPATIVTRTGSYRLLAVPALEASAPSLSRSQMIANFGRYARETTFIDKKEAADELLAQWADADGDYRSDVAYVRLDGIETDKWVLQQQHLPPGSQVCVFGRYSSERRGIVPSAGGPVRVIRGSAEQVAASLRATIVTRGLLGVAFAAAAAGLLWIFSQA
jgi:hypothetical protein